MIRLFKTTDGNYFEVNGMIYSSLESSWDKLINRQNLFSSLIEESKIYSALIEKEAERIMRNVLAPIESQEVWAAGVTYLRSRDARMEESENAKTAYDRVYDADRPEIFFKALPHRVAHPFQEVYIRKDSNWNVPEPEVTLFINKYGDIIGYTAGNDMSSRSIEGENTLYLPQAKTYERSAALGPSLVLTPGEINPMTTIDLKIYRANACVFHGKTTVSTMKRKFGELRDYLLRGLHFDHGCYLMTGTGIVPDSSFTLEASDEVHIHIDGVGVLVNTVKWY